jgi:16S rRNA G1207 methylase RsmC
VRTTILLDDDLARRFQETARKRGQSLSAFLAEAGQAALDARPEPVEPFDLIVESGTGVFSGVNLDRTSDLLAAEDEGRYGARP